MPERWAELRDRYELTKSAEGIEGTRVFKRDDANGTILPYNANYAAPAEPPATETETLPGNINSDPMIDTDGHSTITNCKLRSFRVTKPAFDHGGPTNTLYVCRYSTTPSGGYTNAGRGVSDNENDRSFSGGAEFEFFEGAEEQWEWDGTTDAVTIPLKKRTSTGKFTVPKAGLNSTQKVALFDDIIDYLGTINSGNFEGFAAGQVLFSDFDGGTVHDTDGSLKWSFNLNFHYRILKGPENITQDDWLYIYDPDSGEYKKPKVAGSSPAKYLYEKTTFSGLV